MAEKKGMLDWYFKSNLLSRIMIALIAGVVIGIALGYGDPATTKAFVDNTKFFGDLFIRLLKMIVVPVILFSLIAGAASIAPSRLGRVGVKIMVYYLATSALAVAIGLAFANVFQPGAGMGIVMARTEQGATLFLVDLPDPAVRVERVLDTIDRTEVRTVITMKDSKKVPVAYRMLPKNGKWMVYDVLIENISLVKNYRTQFQDILNTDSPENLIARIKAKAVEVQQEHAK